MAELSEVHITALREQYAETDLKGLAQAFRSLEARYEEAKAISAGIYAEFEFLRKNILPTRMDEMGIQTVLIKDVGRIQILPKLSATQIDKIALQEWLTKEGHGSLVAETVNSSSLAAFIKAQIADGEPIPDDSIIKISTYEVASVVKA